MGDVRDRGDGARPVDMAAVFRALPTAYTLLDPAFTVVDVNAEFLRLTGRERHEVLGRDGFEVYPTFPATLVDGRNPLRELFDRVLGSGQPESVPLLRYDVAPTAQGRPLERWWSLACSPLLDDAGAVEFLLFHAEDVSAYVLDHERGLPHETDPALGARLLARLEAGRVAQAARAEAARRLSALAETALRLASARTVDDVVRAVAGHALASIGADAARIAVPGGTGWRVVSLGVDGAAGGDLQRHDLPPDSPLPVCVSARTGERVLLPDAAAVDAHHPLLASLRAANGRRAWAALPLTVEGRVIGGLSAGWSRDHAFTAEDLELLDGCAAQCAQALERIVGERSAAEEVRVVRRLSETLQRSLLTRPPVREGLRLAMRYQPATRGAEVGGDWFDAFATRSGGTVLVVGDVVGHDQVAAAAMGQVRNMVRGIAFDGDDRPATLLTRLDQAMAGLELGALATAVLAVVDPPLPGIGARRLRWTNAGHLPPLLRHTGGRVEVLDTCDDLMLGVDATSPRHEHVVALEPGDVLVLYTDGLVERRGLDIDDGVAGVRATLQARDVLTAQGWADSLLTTMRASGGEDDTALLVVHVEAAAPVGASSPDAAVDVVLPADPRSVRDARRLTNRCCNHNGVDDDTTETVVLLTSELVTNAIVHGRSDARLKVVAGPRSVHVEVADDNDRVPVLQTHDDEALSGRGISLLEVAATRWGVEEAPIGKVVWFTLDASG
ncbi:ATP-binding SpoIIE family protein phosphatase [Kineococcus rhizosphaerae]|uniref:PAS domain S-box-containing protein n=1 Tax=Kineococcus rhizosphaerae TaxID=559628 RepID=A0A2T0QYG7_9ACTN|nr:SpoIIE family protein phosphatase [Kineococcus rhizosphaerae]PRY11168.1 PAS domain S-box-containing protein [Kineococcus rhizosphaerae]